ncbi:tetratricopeptide repeat protein [Puerhibacterium puerhi]|uniref:tetratricopeptide repeat protein n=1 Tax=Puerhibacterium puerhi TaxID=2692623 RepID=UPI00135A60B7|nr:tetratricopeptide repeat protein [Puerhibacterium puerhi]
MSAPGAGAVGGAAGAPAAGGPAVDAEGVVRRARLLAEAGRVERAVELVDEALGQEPDSGYLLIAAASLRLQTGRPREAREILEAVTAVAPELPGPLYLLSRARQETGDLDGARASIAAALELDPSDAVYHLQLADVVLDARPRRKDKALARERIASARELAPEDPDVLLECARLRMRLGDGLQALQHVLQGLEVAPEHEGLRYAEAQLRPDDAARARGLGDVLAANPAHTEAAYWLHVSAVQRLMHIADAPVWTGVVLAWATTLAMADGWSLVVTLVSALCLLRLATGARRSVAVTRTMPPGYARRTATHGRQPWLRPLLVGAAWAGVVAVAVALLFVRDAVAVRWVLVALTVVELVGAAGSALVLRSVWRSAGASGLYPAGDVGVQRVDRLRVLARSVLTKRLVVAAAMTLVALGSGLRTGRGDALGPLAVGAGGTVLAVVVLMWVQRRTVARLRSDGAAGGGRPAGAHGAGGAAGLVAAGAAAALAVVAGLAALPVGPNRYDADGTYALTGSSPRSGGSGLTDRERQLIEDLRTRGPQPYPTLDLPELDGLEGLEGLDLDGAGEPAGQPTAEPVG